MFWESLDDAVCWSRIIATYLKPHAAAFSGGPPGFYAASELPV